jgi:hypothetical protein
MHAEKGLGALTKEKSVPRLQRKTISEEQMLLSLGCVSQ